MAVGTFVHDIGSREIRVRFDAPVLEADDAGAYALVVSPSNTRPNPVVPSVVDAAYYDADRLSVKLVLSAALSSSALYDCSVSGLFADDGSAVSTLPFTFAAADRDIPIAVGAFQSLTGHIDVIFDRPVAVTSVAAVALLLGGGPGTVLMTLVPWSSGQSEYAVRFSYASAQASGPYSIRYDDVTDSSNNVGSGQIPVTLAYEANGYSELIDLQIVSANIVDVSNAKGFETAVVRVHFNCPVTASSVTNTANWTCDQSGAHMAPDPDNAAVSPNASDLPSLITLVNELKLRLNNHFMSHAHIVVDAANMFSTADAIDLATACSLLSAEQDSFLNHLELEPTHSYPDQLHSFDEVTATILSTAISAANTLKANLNGHILEDYPLAFSSMYSPLGPIANFASSSTAAPVSDQHTWFVDLHLATGAVKAPLNIGCTVAPESGGLYVLDAVAQPMTYSPTVLSVTPFVRGAVIRMASGGEIQDMEAARLRQGVSTAFRVSARPSLPSALWAFNNALHAYSMHISNPAVFPYLGAGHLALDVVNTVSLSNYASVMDLSALISKVNAFKTKLNAHITSSSYHFGSDEGIDVQDATDMNTLADLIESIQTCLTRHNSSGFEPNALTLPALRMYHSFPGIGVLSASLRDLIVVETDCLKIGDQTQFEVPVVRTWRDNRPNVSDQAVPGVLSCVFTGIDAPPVLVSAVARPGFNPDSPSPIIVTDSVDLYMSKSMRTLSILPSPHGSLPYVSIGSMAVVGTGWLSDRVASIQVVNMQSIGYSASASNFQDVAGNFLYEIPVS